MSHPPRRPARRLARRSVVLAALVALGAGALVACSPEEAETGGEGVKHAPSVGQVDGEGAGAPALDGATTATSQLRIAACPPGAGPLTASGSIEVPEGDPASDYVVTVTWVTASGGVVAEGWAAVPSLEPGTATPWEVPVDLGEQEAAACTAQLRQGSLG